MKVKHPVKMIVTDLDGTLLRTDKSISERTIAVLNQCRKAGIKVVCATGRGASAEKVAPLELFDARITQNGGLIVMGNKIVSISLINHKAARPFLMACDKKMLKTVSETGGIHYTNFDCDTEWPGSGIKFKIVDFSQHDMDAEKLCVLINNPEEAQFVESHLPEELYLSLARDGLGMIMNRDATKAKALTCLARIWNIEPGEIAAFGDDQNDIDMLQYAGIGVAMGNALAEVKAAADYICQSNDEDGLAEWITNTLL